MTIPAAEPFPKGYCPPLCLLPLKNFPQPEPEIDLEEYKDNFATLYAESGWITKEAFQVVHVILVVYVYPG